MKKIQLLILTALSCLSTYGQLVVRGRVVDEAKNPLPGANVYVENSYDGTSSDGDGRFALVSARSGEQCLIVSFIGFVSARIPLPANADTTLQIRLLPEHNKMNEVVITAGSFGTDDEDKMVALRAVDILTTPTSEGDIYGALRTLPGTNQVGEDGRLFVRGGEAYEAKTFIDGLEMQSPYNSSTPDIPARGRFSPNMFSGTLFSTGGYAAEYGHALSSALILRTADLPDESQSSFGLLNVGLQGGHTKRFKRGSIGISGEYYNLDLANKVNPIRQKFTKNPRQMNGLLTTRLKVGKSGMLKSLYSINKSEQALPYATSAHHFEEVSLKATNHYWNISYREQWADSWLVYGGSSANYGHDDILFDDTEYTVTNRYFQAKAGLKYLPSDRVKLNFGVDAHWQEHQRTATQTASDELAVGFTQKTFAPYFDGQFQLGTGWALGLGFRPEYFTLNNQWHWAPRLSFARKTGKHSQLSVAYGIFLQTAPAEFVAYAERLRTAQASHRIVNYHYVHDKREFRVEAYDKRYRHLVKFNANSQEYHPDYYTSGGSGYSRGLDLFFRDQKSHPLLDYWISYSFLDSKRDYRDFVKKVQPGFVAKHTLSVVGKYWLAELNTQLGVSYFAASGRYYDDPNRSEFMDRQAPANHNLSLNLSHLTYLFNNFTIIHFSVSNVLGRDKPFTYRYGDVPNAAGIYEPIAVEAETLRSFILGIFIQIK